MPRWCWAASTSVGREQRGLAARVDDLEHRPQRAQRLAGADLALQQPVHRVWRCQVRRDLLADVARWPVGQLVRQAGVEGVEQAAGLRGRGIAGPAAARSLRCTRVSCTANASSHLSRRAGDRQRVL